MCVHFLYCNLPSHQFGLKSGYSWHVGLTQLSKMTSVNTAVPLPPPLTPLGGSGWGGGRGMRELWVRPGGGGGVLFLTHPIQSCAYTYPDIPLEQSSDRASACHCQACHIYRPMKRG
jgi:hypothetical protein